MSNLTVESTVEPIIVPNGEGEIHQAFGDTLQVKLTGEQTGNTIAVGLAMTPAGAGPPPHLHRNEDELFLVQEGRVSFFVNGAWTEVGPGGVVYVPRGTIHTFQNIGETTCRLWLIATPSGFENFFVKCAGVFAAGGPPDRERIMAISAEHGIEFVMPESAE